MIRNCDQCYRRYDDADCTTICPHNPLGANPAPGGFCRRCDMFPPCVCGYTERAKHEPVSSSHTSVEH